jgi:hypothetical protein
MLVAPLTLRAAVPSFEGRQEVQTRRVDQGAALRRL